MESLASWLVSTSPHALASQHAGWLTPALTALHLLSICVVLTTALLTALRLADMTGSRWTPARWGRRFGFWNGLAMTMLLASGLTLTVIDPKRILGNRIFQAKLLLLVPAWLIARHLTKRLKRLDRAPPLTTDKLLAWLDILLWLAIIACGKWAAYAG